MHDRAEQKAEIEGGDAAQRLGAILDSITDFAVVVTDLDGHITEWNAGAEHVLGWSAGEMRGQTAERFFTPEDRAEGRLEVEMAGAREKGRASDERWHLKKDGSRFWASGEMMPLRSPGGAHAGYVKVLRDWTAQHQSQQALAAAEGQLQRAQEAGGVGLFSVEIADNTLTPTPEFCRLYGLSVTPRFPAAEIEALVLAEDRELISSSLTRRTGKLERKTTYRIRVAGTGALRWIERIGDFERDLSGAPIRFVGIVRDVTEEHVAANQRMALLDLTDRFSRADEVAALTDAASDILGVTLGVELVGYGSVDPDAETITVDSDWTRGDAQSLAGTLNFRDFGVYIDDLKRGGTVVVRDARTDPRTAEYAQALEARSARAFVNAPVFERGVFRALLYVSTAKPRDWSEGELGFITEVATRTRAATARLQAEIDRRDSQAELRLVADALPLLVAFVDRSLTYRFANSRYEEWFGLSAEQVVGRKVQDVVSPSDWAARRALIERALAGEPVRFDADWPLANGSPRIADIAYTPRRTTGGVVDGFYVFIQDVTAQRRAEALLSAQNRTLSAERDRLWETTNDLMGTATLDGRLRAVNPAWTTLLGWSEDELLSRPFLELIDPADHAETAVVVSRLAAGAAVDGFVDSVLSKDGSARTIMWTAVPEPGTNLFYIIGRDLTDQRRFEADLRQSQKMEAVGQLTGGVAHDFNNLLTIIRSSIDFLKRDDLSAARRARYVEAISDTVERAAKLTSQLLAFARRQPLKPQTFDVSARVQEVANLIRPLVGSRIAIEVEPCAAACFTEADVSQFETALVNLSVNARDAMEGEGRLTFRVREVSQVPAIRGHTGATGAFIAVDVADTGPGIPAEQIANIFEPFYTTKEVGKGTGLGLSQVFGFTKQSGGEVDVGDEPGRGAVFTLYLPRVEGDAAATSGPQAAPEKDAPSRSVCVLVVEDNEAVGRFADEMLRDLGYRTQLVGNATEALAALEPEDAGFDVVFSDVIMPGMSGLELAREISRRRPELPVVLTSGYSNVLAQEGTHGFELLRKPYSIEELSRILRKLT